MLSHVPVSRYGEVVIGISWMETFLALVMISLRIYTRIAVAKANFGWDDAFIVASGVLIAASTAANTVACVYGYAHHYFELSATQFSESILMVMVCETTMLIGMITAKWSVGLFLLRIAAKTWHRVLLWIIMASLAIVCIFTALVNWFQCTPIDFAWSNHLGPGTCWVNISVPSIFAQAWSVLLDFSLAALPWAIVYPLNMRKDEKMNICLSLSVGVFAGVCGIVKAYELKRLEHAIDYTWATVPTILWSLSELVITVLCANVPCLRPLYHKVRARSTGGGSSTLYPSDDSMEKQTIGSKRQKSYKEPYGTWNELDDVTFADNLSVPKRGQHECSAVGGRNNGSEESILRDARQHGIHVKEDLVVTNN